MLCDSETGYILSTKTYTGKKIMGISQLGASSKVVTCLLHAAKKKPTYIHVLTMDRY